MRLFCVLVLLLCLCPFTLSQQTAPPALPPVASTVVVVGTPEPIAEGESPRPVFVLDTQLHPLAYGTVEDYLRADPSLYVEQRGAGGIQADISLRGGSSAQALVLVNGLRINDAQTSHHNLDLPLPLEAMSGIQVLHGAGSSLYGADALTGVVDFLTAAPTTDSLKLRAGAGSYGENEQSVIAGAVGRRWSEAATGSRNFSTGFIPDRDYRAESASSETRYRTPLGDSSVLLAGSDRAFGADQFYGPYNSWERTKGWFASARQALGEQTEAAFGYRRHTDNFILLRDDPAVYANNHVDTSWQGALRRHDDLGRKATLFYGLEAQGDAIDSNNLGRHARNRGAGYADVEWRPAGQRATVSLGLREEVLSGGARSVLSPNLAAGIWVGRGLKLRGAAGYGFRLPTYTDLYYSDPTTIGNPLLKPESSWSGEGGADWYPTAKIATSLTVFYARQHNAIDYVRTDPSQRWQASNLTGLRFTGAEGSFAWYPRSGQSLTLAWTALSGAQDALHGLESEYIFNYPVNNASAEWSGPLTYGILLRNRVGVTQRYHSTAYPVWDTSVVSERGWLHPYLQITNFSNTGYEEIAGVPMQGRSFIGGVELVLSRR